MLTFLRVIQLAMRLLAVAMEFWSKGNIKVISLLRHLQEYLFDHPMCFMVDLLRCFYLGLVLALSSIRNQLPGIIFSGTGFIFRENVLQAVFLRHEGHAGAMGALLSTLNPSNPIDNLLLDAS